MLKMKNSRSHNTVTTLWPFGRHTRKPTIFEHVHLPDEGQEFLKPSLAMLIQEVEGSPDPRHEEAVAHFQTAEEKFESWQYRHAAATSARVIVTISIL